MTTNKKYVIIDTDCGIDDAIAIMLATYGHKQNLIDILAITCIHGNTSVDNVVKNVCLTLRASDLQQIQVYKGCEGPILGKHESAEHYSEDGLGGVTKEIPDIEVNIDSEHAVNALIRLAKQYPKQITVIALGPLTNIALAYQLDNQFFDNLNEIVFMGGTIDSIGNVEPSVEFNVARDPEACHVMLTNANCPLAFIPWECGLSNLLTWDIWHEMAKINSIKADFSNRMLRKDYERRKAHGSDRKGFILCDILAVIAVIYPDFIESTQVYPTSIELSGTLTRGQLLSDKRTGFSYKKLNAPDVKFITHFDQTKYMQLMIDLVK